MEDLKPIMIVDLDDVICEGGYLRLFNDFFGTNFTKEDLDDLNYTSDLVSKFDSEPKDYERLVRFWIFCNPYLSMHLIDGAYENLQKLNAYFQIYIDTDPYFPSLPYGYLSLVYKQKFDYILSNLDFILPQNIIFSKNKNILGSSVKFQVDDRIGNLKSQARNKILFSSYANYNISKRDARDLGLIKLDNWYDVYNYVMQSN